MLNPMLLRRRIAIALAVFAVMLALGIYRQPDTGSGDLTIPLCAADHLLRGLDPYTCNTFYAGRAWPSNPLTTVIFAAAFLPLQTYAAQFIFATISALMAFALTQKRGEAWRLLAFLSPCFFLDFWYLQWAPLLMAAYYLPNLLPLSLVKPHIAIPVILSRLTRRRFVALAAVGLFTLAIDPTWPLRWLPQASAPDSYIPLLRFPFLFGLALFWRDGRARFLLLMAVVPQRGLYDLLLLWTLPRSWREMLLLNVWSWAIALQPWPDVALKDLIGFYLPSLALVSIPRIYPTITAKLRPTAAAV